MRFSSSALRLVVVDDDATMLADAARTTHDNLTIQTVIAITLGDAVGALPEHDVIAINLGVSGGFALVEALGARRNGPPVIAMASVGALGQSLEYTLTLAELRGAAIGLAKPIDAAELVVAAIDVLEAREGGATRLDVLRKEFARRAAA